MNNSQKIVKRKLSDDVTDRLLEMIDSGKFAPGDTLPSERELMERFGVGRPAIREAMQSLQSAGLIAISHGQRPRVTQPTAQGIIAQIDLAARHLLNSSPASLEHLKDARLLFETGIVRQAAEKATETDIERLQAALDRQKQCFKAKKPNQFVEADMAFHIAIAETTKNPIFIATSQAMLGWLKQFHSKLLHWEGNEHITLEEHQNIVDLIASNNSELAEQEMIDHLNRSRSSYQLDNNKAVLT